MTHRQGKGGEKDRGRGGEREEERERG